MSDKTLSDSERKLLQNIHNFFQAEKNGDIDVPIDQATKRFHLATGVYVLEINTMSEGEGKILRKVFKFFHEEMSCVRSSRAKYKPPVDMLKKRFFLATGHRVSALRVPQVKEGSYQSIFERFQLKKEPDIDTSLVTNHDVAHFVKRNIKIIILQKRAKTVRDLLKLVENELNFYPNIKILKDIVIELGFDVSNLNNLDYTILYNPTAESSTAAAESPTAAAESPTAAAESPTAAAESPTAASESPTAESPTADSSIADRNETPLLFDIENGNIINYMTICKIRNIIQSKEARTMATLEELIQTKLNLHTTKDLLKTIVVEKLGYHIRNWKGIEYIMDNPMIAACRAGYLRKMKENDERSRKKKKPVIYIGETVFLPTNTNKLWDAKTNRMAIAHAGGEKGFVDGAGLVYKLKATQPETMDEYQFSGWVWVELLPNLPKNCIVVISSTAPHHCHCDNILPPISAEKDVTMNWLSRNGIAFETDMTKKELYYLIKTARFSPAYTVDITLKKFGHEVLRLPPFHDDLNPIEYIWQSLQTKLNEVNSFITNPKVLCLEILENLGLKAWKNALQSVNELRKTFWELEMQEDCLKLEYIIHDQSCPEFKSEDEDDIVATMHHHCDSRISIDIDDKMAGPSSKTTVTNRVEIKEEPDQDIDIEEFIIGDEKIVIQEECEIYEDMETEMT